MCHNWEQACSSEGHAKARTRLYSRRGSGNDSRNDEKLAACALTALTNSTPNESCGYHKTSKVAVMQEGPTARPAVLAVVMMVTVVRMVITVIR